MKFERGTSLPEKNELPLDIQRSEKHKEGGESEIWKTLTKDNGGQENLIALKQVRRETFASDEEMKKSKEFYDFLKSFPKFGKFVPDTLYFKARLSENHEPQSYALQRFIEGKTAAEIKDDELYKDPEVVAELQEFAQGAVELLQAMREKKMPRPDLSTSYDSEKRSMILGNYLFNPRYSSNILIANKADKHGQRVFFIDTGINADDRISKTREVVQKAKSEADFRNCNCNDGIKTLQGWQVIEKKNNHGPRSRY